MENIIQLKTCWDVTIQEKIIDSVSVRYIKADHVDADERLYILIVVAYNWLPSS